MKTRRSFLAGLGLAGLALAGGVGVVRGVTPPPAGLRRWAAAWGGRWVWIERERIGEIRMPAGPTAEFTVERRDVMLGGTRVWLGSPVLLAGGDLQVGPGDAEVILGPLLQPPPSGPAWRLLAIDAGHGGRDRGTENREHGWQEKVVVLDLAQRLARQLGARGRRVMLTRTDDTFIPLDERPARAHAAGADLFVSLHVNAGPPLVTGVETFVLPPVGQPATARAEVLQDDHVVLPGNAQDADNSRLGYLLQDRLRRSVATPDRGLRRARFAVLRPLRCPGALIEAGFLSNPEEGRRLASPDYREHLAARLADALVLFRHSR